MKKLLAIITICFLFVVFVVYQALSTGKGMREVEYGIESVSRGCSQNPPRTELLLGSPLSSVRKLGELDEKCNSASSNKLMYFTYMPKDAKDAQRLAQDIAKSLKEFDEKELEPIIVVEPDSSWGLVDFNEFNSGFWDSWIKEYFKSLKAEGIKDEMMGTWVPFPEANLPLWNHQNTKPEDFSKAVNRYLGIMKKYFPGAKGSILLNSTTYPTDDFNWAEGEYVSLRPYIEGIDRKLIDSFGLQGFPWMPPANEEGDPIFEAVEFINPNLAVEAADILGTKNIWFNTGTFAAKYVGEGEQVVTVPASVRKEILDRILTEARGLKAKGYNISINLFAEDKSDNSEATDWSYWGSDNTQNKEHEIALTNLLKEAYKLEIPISFYLKR